MEKELQKLYLASSNLLVVQDLWQGHYQILSIIFMKAFIKLNINEDVIKIMKRLELNTNIVSSTVLITKTLKMIAQ